MARSYRDMLLRALRQIIGPVIGVAVVAYFAYHTVQGERGLGRLGQLRQDVGQAEAELARLTSERMAMEHRAQLLRPDNLDPDMLEERARKLLNAAHPDELVILLPGKKGAPDTPGVAAPAAPKPAPPTP
jgi:cell division protein FtsB